MEDYIKEIIEDASSTYGADFLQKITLKLNKVLKADYTYIAEADDAYEKADLVVWVARGELSDTFSYPLKDTPCSDVMCEKVACFPRGVASAFPEDEFLADLKIEGYIGTAIRDSKGRVMGLIAALYERDISDEQALISGLFQVFSGRIAAELERARFETSLEDLNETLEAQVHSRTRELTTTLANLQAAQQQLVESEKMAALGRLVTGVAHEVNTPLGIAITAHSFMEKQFGDFRRQVEAQQLTIEDMDKYCDSTRESLRLQAFNLNHAKDLIDSFKRTAADQHVLEEETINLREYYADVISTLSAMLNTKRIRLQLDIPTDLTVRTLPGVHAQVLSNLIENSARHGFDATDADNRILITGFSREDGSVQIDYSDNGKGLNAESREKIFEPFYTTARSEGGTGLGMSIVYNLIVQSLKGQIELLPGDSGVSFCYRFSSFQG
ncbi:sensor histidine kinase [Aliamphritea hakodatensis]|uniref:sensor histidine kinase n=1 Tax=Aliamphritea hakodatensis TaxID=2895352 RepID=UPI0022FD825E|nr:HAMP domain-containing sensor histidine kinase [Aliamphritea hakodatensis]